MDGNSEQRVTTGGASLLRYALPAVFFGAYFLFVLLIVEPTLIYHSLGRSLHYPAFRASWEFCSESVSACGGPVEYLAAFISHLFYINWAGALFYTVVGFLLWLSARTILRIPSIRHVEFVAYLPAVALLVLCTGYNHQPLIVLSAALGVLAFIGYVKLASRTPSRAAFPLIALMTCGLFYLSVNGCIMYWIMVFLYEGLHKRRFMIAGSTAVLGATVGLAGWALFDIDMYPLHWQLNRVIGHTDSITPDTYPLIVLYGLYLFFPLLLIVSSLRAGRPIGPGSQSVKTKHQEHRAGSPGHWLSPVIQALVLAVLCIAMLRPALDVNKKHSLKIRALAQKEQWSQLLDYCKKNRLSGNMSILEVHDIMLALYYTDALAEDMFDWPVELRSLTLPRDIAGFYCDIHVRRSNLVLEMGCLGLSEKFAYEALVNFGDQARILENLATINMVKGDIQTARVFLNVLGKDINHSDRGRYWLDILANDPQLSNHDRIKYLRSLVDKGDDAFGSALTMDYEQLLEWNPANKMAREFMMCQFLLTGQLERFTVNLDRYEAFDAGGLPKCYDQALALYRATGGKTPCKWVHTATSADQVREFLNIVNLYRGDKKKLYHATRQAFGDSYYFYHLYRGGGVGSMRVRVLMAATLGMGIASFFMWSCRGVKLPEDFVSVDSPPPMEPDYSSSTIPFNIAPLNFNIRLDAREYMAGIYTFGDPDFAIHIASDTGSITIDRKKWQRLLEASKGETIVFAIFTRDADGQWTRHGDIVNTVSEHPIPGYLAYRYLKPTYNWWHNIDILQQSLETSAVSAIIDNSQCDHTCVNCHSFPAGNPETMAVGFRGSKNGVGTLIYADGELKRISAKWGYTSWHPSGKLAAYSMNKVRQFFHSSGREIRDVIDLDSAIVCYTLGSDETTKVDALAEKDYLETYPHFSPDGKYLYFCRAPVLWEDRDTVPPKQFRDVRYSILRISYDIDTDTWGELEPILSAEETGKSMLIPRISPDGRYMIFCMCDYGCFPIHQQSSDLYVMDLQTRQYRPLVEANSPYSESWHNYSNSGRWLVFSSKRQGGLFTRPYFSYIDDHGNAHKPFVLPQRDPEHYYKTLETYSVPEFLMRPVEVSPRSLAKSIQEKDRFVEIRLPITGATRKEDAQEDPGIYDR